MSAPKQWGPRLLLSSYSFSLAYYLKVQDGCLSSRYHVDISTCQKMKKEEARAQFLTLKALSWSHTWQVHSPLIVQNLVTWAHLPPKGTRNALSMPRSFVCSWKSRVLLLNKRRRLDTGGQLALCYNLRGENVYDLLEIFQDWARALAIFNNQESEHINDNMYHDTSHVLSLHDSYLYNNF